MLEPDERGCATILANDVRGIARNRPFGPVAAGGDGADSRPVRHTAGAYPRLESRAPIVPAPAVLRRLQRSLPASTGRQRGVRSEALTASAPVAGGRITDMVVNVKPIHPHSTKLTVAPHLMRGPAFLKHCGSARQRSPVSSTGRRQEEVESGHWGMKLSKCSTREVWFALARNL